MPALTAASLPPHSRSASTPMIARQAIVDGNKTVIGYELFHRARSAAELAASTDVMVLFTSLAHAGLEDMGGNKLLFIPCPHESLTSGQLDLLNPARVVLEIEPLGHVAQSEALARLPILHGLRARGFKLAFNHAVLESAYAPWLPLADFIKLDVNVLRPEQLAVLTSYAARHSPAQLIASSAENAEQLDWLQQLGVQLFQGYRFSRPTTVHAKVLTPRLIHIIELINLLRHEASPEAIEDVLKKDAALAYSLMRLINSAGFHPSREITSFKQAVMIIGVNKLFRWAILLLTASQLGSHDASIGPTAVIRARLMELLALEFLSEEEAEQAFVVGIFSMLDAMLELPLANALELIHLPASVRAALLTHTGVLSALLQLAQACETGHSPAWPEDATVPLSTEQINRAHLQALAWCDQITA